MAPAYYQMCVLTKSCHLNVPTPKIWNLIVKPKLPQKYIFNGQSLNTQEKSIKYKKYWLITFPDFPLIFWKNCQFPWLFPDWKNVFQFSLISLISRSGRNPDSGGSRISQMGCANPQGGDANMPTCDLTKFFPKTAWKWKKLYPEGGARPWHPLLVWMNL